MHFVRYIYRDFCAITAMMTDKSDYLEIRVLDTGWVKVIESYTSEFLTYVSFSNRGRILY